MTTDSIPSPGRRAFYAAVALADLPMPERITFAPGPAAQVRLCFDSTADCAAWARALNISLTAWRSNGEDATWGEGTFADRPVCLLGEQPVPVPEPLPTGTTRARLERLVQEAA
jgi:hypothetical protein